MHHSSTSLLILLSFSHAISTIAVHSNMTGSVPVTQFLAPPSIKSGSPFQVTPPSPEAHEKCQVLAGSFAMAMQGLLLICCLTVLYLKFKKEKSNRTWNEFLLDSSKQLAGAGWIHVLNLAFATYLESRGDVPGDQCEWYWVNIMIDTTLGVWIEYVVLRLLIFILVGLLKAEDFNSGEYRDAVTRKVSAVKYLKQLIIWLIVVGTMKTAILWIMMTFTYPLHVIAHGVLTALPFLATPRVKLVVVMILTPTLMNAFQFYVVDHFIKGREHMLGGKAEPLLPPQA